MATKQKISDFFNAFSNPSGSAPFSLNLGNSSSAPLNSFSNKLRGNTPKLSELFSAGSKNMTPFQPTQGPVQQTPIASTSTPVPAPSSQSPLFNSNPVAPTPQSSPVTAPSQWLKEDGSFYTPEEVAANIEQRIMQTRSGGDVSKLAGDQFSTADRSAVDLRGDATQINNARNDIAVGATDPYKIASQSGIAYSPAELAAIEKSYSGIYDPALNTAMAKYEAKQEEDRVAREIKLKAEADANAPYTLSKDEVRYENGQPVAVGISSDSGTPGSGVYTPGASADVDAYIKAINSGSYKVSDIPSEYRGIVAQGLAATRPTVSQEAQKSIKIIDDLLGSEDLGTIAGIKGPLTFLRVPGTEGSQLRTWAKQLMGSESLKAREALQGSGAISDFEFKVLRDAATALGIDDNGFSSLSNEDFENGLRELKATLEIGPTSSLSIQDAIDLYNSGYKPEEIRRLDAEETATLVGSAFSPVGNTTASRGTGNVPQRNLNPGNVKAGGLADSLAIGTDEQGHLIFPNQEAGFKALAMDLTAKINGGSRYLPANPTIAQLGKVYAEDPNWPISVSKILGVSPTTPTKNIPINQLAEAIAKQEGFYA